MTTAAKGALVVAQSGGPTPVINASLAGVIQAANNYDQVSNIYGLVNGLAGALSGEYLALDRVSDKTLERLIDTPAAALGSGRYKVLEPDYERIVASFKGRNIHFFIHIGGNGSMFVTHRLAQAAAAAAYDLAVMGVPKTIDNDLACTDHAPGYGSAARFLALATRDTGRDQEAMVNFEDVTILECLGRDAGWLAAGAALGKDTEDEAPHLVYLPEIPFDEVQFLDDVVRVHQRLERAFVIVGEGLRDVGGEFVGRPHMTDPVGRVVHSMTAGVSAYLTDLVRERLRLQARSLRPSLIGRAMSACISRTDRREALLVGRTAVKEVMAGHSGFMVTLERTLESPYTCRTGLVDLAEVAGAEKNLPREYMNEEGNMVTAAFRRYALPLIGGPLPPLARLVGS